MVNSMSREDLLKLRTKTVVGVEEAGRALGISRQPAYNQAKAGTFPVPVLRVGHSYRVPTGPLLRYLGVDPDEPDHRPHTPASTSNGEPDNSSVVRTKRGTVIEVGGRYKFSGKVYDGADVLVIARALGVAS